MPEVFFLPFAWNFAGCFSTTMATLPPKTQDFGLNKATGLRKGVVEVEGVVLV